MKNPLAPIALLPPPRKGVGPSSVLLLQEAWRTVAEFLTERFPGILAEVWDAWLWTGFVIAGQRTRVGAERRDQLHVRLDY